MEAGDVLPPGVCGACAADLATAANFKHLHENSILRWTEATTYLSKINIDSKDRTVFLMCEDDDIISCEKRFDSIQSAATTLRYIKRPRKPRGKQTCACPSCGKKFRSTDALNEHLKNGMKSICSQCGSVFNKVDLPSHLRAMHRTKTPHCNVCYQLFSNHRDVVQHTRQFHGPSAFSCETCGRGYTTERGLRAHRYSHTLFSCPECGLSFENNRCYRYHGTVCKVKRLASFEQYECDYCGAKYNKKPSLKIHIVQKHVRVLPFVCESCGKRTSTRAHLLSHERTHEERRKVLECWCGARFSSQLGLRLHARAHSGVKPYHCRHCADTFISASRRLDHEKRKHCAREELAHACGECSARFIRPSELRKHHAQCHEHPELI